VQISVGAISERIIQHSLMHPFKDSVNSAAYVRDFLLLIPCLLEDEPRADVVDFIAIDQSLDLGFKQECQ
jgi:hypothetical protein